MNSNKFIINLPENDRILIIHHWDCDGLCSAALLYRYLKEINKSIKIEFFLPGIGHYFLEKKDYKIIRSKNPILLFIVDFALPKENILELKKIVKKIYIFDHHKQEKINEVNHVNPFIEDNFNSLDFTSTGWIINKYFGKPQEILSVLGAIGDQEDKIKDNEVVEKVVEENNITFFDCLKIVENIDSNYITNDKNGIYWTLDFLLNKNKNIRFLLSNKKFISNNVKIRKEIDAIINSTMKINNNKKIIIKNFKSDYNIISNVTRELSKRFPEYLIIVINNSNKNISNIYFRRKSININLLPILDFAHQQGYNCGGKEEVVGIYCPSDKVDKIISESLDMVINDCQSFTKNF